MPRTTDTTAREDWPAFLADWLEAHESAEPARQSQLRRAARAAFELRLCERQIDARREQRRRDAVHLWRRTRLAARTAAVALLSNDPAHAVSELRATPEGCAWLLRRWAVLRRALTERGHLQPDEFLTLLALSGRQTEPESRCLFTHELARRHLQSGGSMPMEQAEPFLADGESLQMSPESYLAMLGVVRAHERDGFLRRNAGSTDPQPADSDQVAADATASLLSHVDRERKRLRIRRRRLLPLLEADRAEAVERTLVDTSKEALALRRLAASLGQDLDRALKDLRDADKAAAAPAKKPSNRKTKAQVSEEIPAEPTPSTPEPPPTDVDDSEPKIIRTDIPVKPAKRPRRNTGKPLAMALLGLLGFHSESAQPDDFVRQPLDIRPVPVAVTRVSSTRNDSSATPPALTLARARAPARLRPVPADFGGNPLPEARNPPAVANLEALACDGITTKRGAGERSKDGSAPTNALPRTGRVGRRESPFHRAPEVPAVWADSSYVLDVRTASTPMRPGFAYIASRRRPEGDDPPSGKRRAGLRAGPRTPRDSSPCLPTPPPNRAPRPAGPGRRGPPRRHAGRRRP